MGDRPSDRPSPLGTALPGGRFFRGALVCDPDYIECPRCMQVVRRFTAGVGWSLKSCEAKPKGAPPPGRPQLASCNQAMLIVGTGLGFALVFPLSPAEREYLQAGPMRSAPDVLRTLKVLRERTAAAVPSEPCARCRRDRQRYDLYDGVCRWCRDGTAAPEERAPPAASRSA